MITEEALSHAVQTVYNYVVMRRQCIRAYAKHPHPTVDECVAAAKEHALPMLLARQDTDAGYRTIDALAEIVEATFDRAAQATK
jgi:hypothetical protein